MSWPVFYNHVDAAGESRFKNIVRTLLAPKPIWDRCTTIGTKALVKTVDVYASNYVVLGYQKINTAGG